MNVGVFNDQDLPETTRRGTIHHIFRDTTTEDPYAAVHAIALRGLIPLLTLEPWDGIGRSIQWLKSFATIPGNVYVRYGHEMNGSWYPWSEDPKQYKDDWARLTAASRINTFLVWCPNVDSATSPIGRAFDFWPGSADVVALDGYDWAGGQSPSAIFAPSFTRIRSLGSTRWICETATPRNRMGQPGRDERLQSQHQWVNTLKGYARVEGLKGLVYFDADKERMWAMDDKSRGIFYA